MDSVAQKDFTVKRGDEWSGITLTITNNSTPINLTNATMLMQVKKKACDDTAIYEFSTANGRIVIDNPTAGHFYFENHVIDLDPMVYVYDLKISGTVLGNPKTVMEGTFTVSNNVSR